MVIINNFICTQVPANSLFNGYRRIVMVDDIFDVIRSVHEKGTAHSGVRKTYSVVCVIIICRDQ